MVLSAVSDYIVKWLDEYLNQTPLQGFIVGVSGGIDSALTAHLCAMTGKPVVLLNIPIRQKADEFERSRKQIQALKARFQNVSDYEIDLGETFATLEKTLPKSTVENGLAMANTRARLRMLTLYAIGQANGCLVVGTGNKVEDFGVGFFTKYGDGGVDISPIADLLKTEVYQLAEQVGVIPEILKAPPTDGLWDDARVDEDQIGATYEELEWAMSFTGDASSLTERQKEVLAIYAKFHNANKHKMEPIPVCLIPKSLKS